MTDCSEGPEGSRLWRAWPGRGMPAFDEVGYRRREKELEGAKRCAPSSASYGGGEIRRAGAGRTDAMARDLRSMDALRRGRGANENHLIDGLVDGRVSRREFLRHGSAAGAVDAADGPHPRGGRVRARRRALPARAAGGTIRVAQTVPAASIDPVQIADGGGITVLSQVAENLVLSAPRLHRAAAAGRELVAEQGRHGLDLQAAQGREVPQRQRDECR